MKSGRERPRQRPERERSRGAAGFTRGTPGRGGADGGRAARKRFTLAKGRVSGRIPRGGRAARKRFPLAKGRVSGRIPRGGGAGQTAAQEVTKGRVSGRTLGSGLAAGWGAGDDDDDSDDDDSDDDDSDDDDSDDDDSDDDDSDDDDSDDGHLQAHLPSPHASFFWFGLFFWAAARGSTDLHRHLP